MEANPDIPARFRVDINGLRAWAVVAVVLFHFGVPGFRGGFVGVDVFFVISGFLMTRIVLTGLERSGVGGFSLTAFYLSRARRILPALIALCIALLVLGWFALTTIDYAMLSKHAAFTIAFLSNVQFWREAGYFDLSSNEKWLLHTWSLAVEWQFYLLLPLLLLTGWKIRPGRATFTLLVAAGFAASLIWAWRALMLHDLSSAFYLLPSRAWELLAGGLVLLLPGPGPHVSGRLRIALEIAGLGLVVLACVLLDPASELTGWLAPLPVAGAALVLWTARTDSPWTGHALAQWLGTRSYSLYLWHWPIAVALLYLGVQNDVVAITASLALTVLLGDLSYRWVETPTRLGFGQLSARVSAATLVTLSMGVAAASSWVWSRDGVPGRLSSRIDAIAAESTNLKPRHAACFATHGTESPSCMYGGSRLRAILLGDSHADAVTTALAAAAPRQGDGIMDWSYIGCPTILGVRNIPGKFAAGEDCGGFLRWAMRELALVPRSVPVVVVNRSTMYVIGHNEIWKNDADSPMVYFSRPYRHSDAAFLREFAQRLTDTACELAKDRRVYLMRPIPEMGIDVPRAVARSMALGEAKDIFVSLQAYHQRHAVVWAAQDAARDRCGVRILDPLPYLCRDGRCDAMRDGLPIYYDDNHLSEYGNRLLVPMFAEVFEPEAAPDSPDRAGQEVRPIGVAAPSSLLSR